MRLTIGKKLGLGFGGVLTLMLVSSLMVSSALTRTTDAVTRMSEEMIPALRACDDMLIALNRTTSAMRAKLLMGDNTTLSKTFENDFDAAVNDVLIADNRLHEIYSGSKIEADADNFKQLHDLVPQFIATQQELRDIAMNLGTGADRDLTPAIRLMETRSLPRSQDIRRTATALRESAQARLKTEVELLNAACDTTRWTLTLSTVAGVTLGLLVAFLLSRQIVGAVRSLLAGVQAVAGGNLTIREIVVDSNDEVGELAAGFNKMVFALRTILSEAATTTGEVATASQQIATGAQQQLTSLNQTATSLNEITTTAEEFKATMQEFADRAKAVLEAAEETARRASDGRSLTQDSSQRIEQVRSNAVTAGESVLSLADQMQRIGEITASVNEIAEQTKLLALNASIEAARAGEEGRGFAVVAMQVRELANQSKEAANRIESLITQTQRSMQTVVHKIEEGGRLSEDSTQIVKRVSAAFDEIVRAIEQTREAMSQINAGARQQEVGVTELVSSITEIDSASKESVAAAEQTQKSIVAIDQRIRSLNHSIARFTT